MKNNVKLQINSLEALERLIGGDSQLEIDVRNSVVQAFAEKHLKSVANSRAMERAYAQIQHDIQAETEKAIASFKDNYYNRKTNVELHPDIKEQIDDRVEKFISKTLHDTVDKALEKWGDAADIEKRVDWKFRNFTEQTVIDEVKKRMDAIKSQL